MDSSIAKQFADENFIGVDEAARLLGVPKSWIYAAIREGRIKSYKIGKYRRFLPSELRTQVMKQQLAGA